MIGSVVCSRSLILPWLLLLAAAAALLHEEHKDKRGPVGEAAGGDGAMDTFVSQADKLIEALRLQQQGLENTVRQELVAHKEETGKQAGSEGD